MQNGADAAALAMAKTCAVDPAKCVAGGADQPLLNTLNNEQRQGPRRGLRQHRLPLWALRSGEHACRGAPARPVRWPTARNSPRVWPQTPAFPTSRRTRRRKATNGTSILPTWLVRTLAGRQHRRDRPRLCAGRLRFAGPHRGLSPDHLLDVRVAAEHQPAETAYYPYDPAQSPGGYFTRPGNPPASRRGRSAATTPATPGQEIIITLQGGPHMAAAVPELAGPRCRRRLRLPRRQLGATRTIGTDSWIQIDTGNSTSGCDLCAVLEDGHLPPRLRLRDAQPLGTLRGSAHLAGRRLQLRHRQQHLVPHRWVGEVLPQWLQDRRIGREGEPRRAASVPCTGGDRCISGWFLEGVLRDAPVAGPPPPPGSPGFGTYAIQPAG